MWVIGVTKAFVTVKGSSSDCIPWSLDTATGRPKSSPIAGRFIHWKRNASGSPASLHSSRAPASMMVGGKRRVSTRQGSLLDLGDSITHRPDCKSTCNCNLFARPRAGPLLRTYPHEDAQSSHSGAKPSARMRPTRWQKTHGNSRPTALPCTLSVTGSPTGTSGRRLACWPPAASASPIETPMVAIAPRDGPCRAAM